MLRHQIITRAMLKAKGRHLPELYGLPEADFRELTVLARHCATELGLSVTALSALGLIGRNGVRLGLSGQRFSYSVVLSPSGVYLESGPVGSQPRQVFRNQSFDHGIAGQLFRTIQAQENPCLS